MTVQRLDKILTDTGQWSRKEAKELIRCGQVSVNGKVLRQPEQKIVAECAELMVQGMAVTWNHYCYLMLNKPAGVVTATEDREQKTVLDLLPEAIRKQGVAPVGRLDKDTEGLLLLTNDGALTHRLLSPKYHVKKCYLACIDGVINQDDVEIFRAGLVLRDGTRCLPAELEPLELGQCLVTVSEGKYHQVKRMLAACGKPVRALKRISMGLLQLDETLSCGEWRKLTEKEIKNLQKPTNGDKRVQNETEKVYGTY